MQTKISKWGNSLGVRLPKYVIEQLKLNIDNEVDITVTKDSIQIKKRSTLDNMLDQITPENIHNEIFNDQPVGKEIW